MSASSRLEGPGAAGPFELLRLATIGGRSDRLRIVLTIAGSALATSIALLGVTVAFIRTSQGDGPYSINLIEESGLRPGVLIALGVLCVPVVLFVGLCTRVGAPARDRRLAMFRMAGATPKQATRLASYETGLAAGVGGAAGVGVFLLARMVLDEGAVEERMYPTDVQVPVVAFVAVVAALVIGAVGSSSLATRHIRISPFGVTRRQPTEPPTKAAVVLFGIGGAGLLSASAVLRAHPDLLGLVSIFALASFVLCLAGLLLGSASFAVVSGRFLATRTSRADVLIASRRMIDAPFTASRATASVLLAVLIGSAVQATRANILLSQDPADTFYRDSFDLINVVLVIAIVVAAASLVVTSSEAIVERRRTLATLAASGTPRPVIARAAIFESLIPLVPAVLLAAISGTLFARSMFGTTVERLESFEVDAGSNSITLGVPIPWTDLLVLGGGAILASVLATVISLAFLSASTRPTELRAAA